MPNSIPTLSATMPADETFDVVVVGSGNAGFCAACSAAESGARRVLLLDKAPAAWAGGNTTFTAGAYRAAFAGLPDLLPLVRNVGPDLAARVDLPAYSESDFAADLLRVSDGRCDPDLARVLVSRSNDSVRWLARNGVRFGLSFNRQAYEIDGRFRFWGGLVLAVEDGGKGLTAAHRAIAARRGVDVRYSSPVVALLQDGSDGAVVGVRVRRQDTPSSTSTYDVRALGGVVLAAGGFEANPAMRARHLGPGWELAYVRGTPYNTGDVLELALGLGAKAAGGWSSCHSTCWDANAAADRGDPALTNQLTKSGYPLGLMVNVEGRRFVDEGLDMRNYTYAKFGRAILGQPGGVAFQVWDARAAAWLRDEEYAEGVVERIRADSLDELAGKLEAKGLKRPQAFVRTVTEYNAAVAAHRAENGRVVFDPSRKDGLSTRSSGGGGGGGLEPDKTNWALPLTEAPFLAVKVTCGITFTFGGLQIDPHTAAVISERTGRAMDGLYCAGEMVGGLFYGNYPGGSGLTAGAVWGRIAGAHAARRSLGTRRSGSPEGRGDVG